MTSDGNKIRMVSLAYQPLHMNFEILSQLEVIQRSNIV